MPVSFGILVYGSDISRVYGECSMALQEGRVVYIVQEGGERAVTQDDLTPVGVYDQPAPHALHIQYIGKREHVNSVPFV